MDINEVYARWSALLALLLVDDEIDLVEFTELSESIDTWLKGGGFLPSAWVR